MKITVTKEMREAGIAVANDCLSARCIKKMNGLGGGSTWDKWKRRKDIANRDIVMDYAKEKIDSVTAIYIAMERAK